MEIKNITSVHIQLDMYAPKITIEFNDDTKLFVEGELETEEDGCTQIRWKQETSVSREARKTAEKLFIENRKKRQKDFEFATQGLSDEQKEALRQFLR